MSMAHQGGSVPWCVQPAPETVDLLEMMEWCSANIGPRVSRQGFLWLEPRRLDTGWRFRHQDAALLFEMVWG